MNQKRVRKSMPRAGKKSSTAKSGKQKRQNLAAKREVKLLRAAEKKRLRAIAEKRALGVAVDESKLGDYGPFSYPAFVGRGYYVDRPFRCKDCSREEVWTATQQKWWYEVAEGNVRSRATQCNACRRKRREKKVEERVAANRNRAKQGLPPLPEKIGGGRSRSYAARK